MKYWRPTNDVYMFEDPVLRSEEEKDFLIRIVQNSRSGKQFDENEINFGKLYLLSDLNEEPERIYWYTSSVNMWNTLSMCTRMTWKLIFHT